MFNNEKIAIIINILLILCFIFSVTLNKYYSKSETFIVVLDGVNIWIEDEVWFGYEIISLFNNTKLSKSTLMEIMNESIFITFCFNNYFYLNYTFIIEKIHLQNGTSDKTIDMLLLKFSNRSNDKDMNYNFGYYPNTLSIYYPTTNIQCSFFVKINSKNNVKINDTILDNDNFISGIYTIRETINDKFESNSIYFFNDNRIEGEKIPPQYKNLYKHNIVNLSTLSN